jgi:hypothetical protein
MFSRSAGGVIGQTLAMEGVFSFFLESTFLGLLLYGEKRLSRAAHGFAPRQLGGCLTRTARRLGLVDSWDASGDGIFRFHLSPIRREA